MSDPLSNISYFFESDVLEPGKPQLTVVSSNGAPKVRLTLGITPVSVFSFSMNAGPPMMGTV
jgi:hypothetical protein